MAFAAARMIMPKDKAQRKPSSDFQGKGKVREELKKYFISSISFDFNQGTYFMYINIG